METVSLVHVPWLEITKDNNVTWVSGRADCYIGPDEGPDAGPSSMID